MSGVIAIDPQWLPQFAPFHCRFSDPLADPPPFWEKETGKVMCHRKATFGERIVFCTNRRRVTYLSNPAVCPATDRVWIGLNIVTIQLAVLILIINERVDSSEQRLFAWGMT